MRWFVGFVDIGFAAEIEILDLWLLQNRLSQLPSPAKDQPNQANEHHQDGDKRQQIQHADECLGRFLRYGFLRIRKTANEKSRDKEAEIPNGLGFGYPIQVVASRCLIRPMEICPVVSIYTLPRLPTNRRLKLRHDTVDQKVRKDMQVKVQIKGRKGIVAVLTASFCLNGIGVFATDLPNTAKVVTEAHPQAGHSMNGESFNEGPRQKAYLMPGMAEIRFPITTQSAEAKKFFGQGVCQLHGFWYFEAERSFRQVAALDPKCAMAYWGMAFANIENEKRARGFITKAVALKAKATVREERWIDALDSFYKEKQDDKTRRRKLVRDLEAIVQDFPAEIEAKAFLAFVIWTNSQKGLAISSHQSVDALISEILREQPMHPGGHHYRIHLWDSEKAERALGSAALIGQSAPGIAHEWHMSGHIFSKVKRYDDAAWQQEASARVDHAYMIRDRVLPYQIHNYAHNNQWLATDLAHQGRLSTAIAIIRNLVEIPRHPVKNSISKDGSCVRMGRERLFDLLPRYELWDEFIALSNANVIEATETNSEQLKRLKWLGVAWYCKGDVANGDRQVEAIKGLAAKEQVKQLEAAKDKEKNQDKNKAKPAAKPAKTEKPAGKQKPEEKPKKAEPKSTLGDADLKELAAWRLLGQGNANGAFEALDKVGGVRKTHLARIASQAGNQAKAQELAAKAVADGVNEVDALASQVFVLHAAGKKAEAKAAFEQLQHIGCRAELSLPCCHRLARAAKELGFPDDWRLQPAPNPEVGFRPALDALGPVCWTPAKAPVWNLAAVDGSTIGSQSYRGKPVLMVFFLGAGCLHCVEQLDKLSPLAKDFDKAGVSLLALSTDDGEAIKEQLAKAAKTKPLPFPIVSDASLTVFRGFRAYDDFEKKPLHATVLVDADGLIRWQDISFEPFTDAKFLLAESQRLLRQAHSSAVVTLRRVDVP